MTSPVPATERVPTPCCFTNRRIDPSLAPAAVSIKGDSGTAVVHSSFNADGRYRHAYTAASYGSSGADLVRWNGSRYHR
jgi:hypothetical protein